MSRVVLHPARVVLHPLPDPARTVTAQAGPPMTLGCWLRYWLEREVAPARASTTVYGYRNIVERHLVPALGSVALAALTPAMISDYYHQLSAQKGLSPNTVRKHHVLLHTALQQAVRRGLLPYNPTQLLVIPRPTPVNPRYYTPLQLSRLLLEVEGHPLELPVKLACFLGLRRSELLGLRWRDVDLDAGLLSVRQVRTTAGHLVVEKQPKTWGSCRTLSILPLAGLMTLLCQLHQHRMLQGIPCGPDDLLVLNARNQPYHPNVLSAAFSAFTTSRGLPAITLHGLRHTFASMASNARVPLYQISRAMGHSSPSTTQRIYTHLFDPTHGEVLAAVAAAIPSGSPRT